MWNRAKRIFNGEWIQSRVEKNDSYKSAVRFSDEFQPHKGKDYRWTLDYAIKEYEQASLRVDSLDEKADTLIGYLGAGSGLIAIGLAYGIGEHKTGVLIAAIPALFLLLAAILLALISRIPSKFPSLPHAKDALEQMQTESDQQAVGKLAASVWVSTSSIALSAREKAKLVRWSYWCFGAGIIWIVLSSTLSSLIR